MDFWKVHPKFAWTSSSSFTSPLVVFPSHLTRLRERVAHELAHNPSVSTVTVLVTVPRAMVDGSTDWVTFARLVDAVVMLLIYS